MTVQILDFVDKDLPSIVKLLNETHKESYEFIPFNEEKLRIQIEKRRLRILTAKEHSEIIGFAAAYADDHWGENIQWLSVSQNSDWKHIENLLVTEIEKQARNETVYTQVDARGSRISEWIKRGYRIDDEIYRMVAKLNGLKSLPRIQEDIILRSLKQDEEKKLVKMVNTAFGWKRLKLGIIEKWKSENPPFNENWIHVAEVDNKIVSAVISKPDTEYNAFFNYKRGYLGPAATLAKFRDQHLVSALTCKGMNFLFEKGMDCARVGTLQQNVPSVTVLRKLGFEVVHHWKIMRKKLAI